MRSGRWTTLLIMALGMAANFAVFGGESNKWPQAEGYWLPEGASTYAAKVDSLFNAILWLTCVVFVITELLLVFFIFKYRYKEGRKAIYTHGSHKLEMIWTITPAVILGAIALFQKSTWDEIKRDMPDHKNVVHIHNYAQQFQWNFRYAGTDEKFDTKDDIILEKLLVVPKDTDIVIEQTSNDVIHSFFLPYMRLKQDAVPGMQIKIWFNATKSSDDMRKTRPDFTQPNGDKLKWEYEIVCAELCGAEHSQMKGIMKVLEPADYKKWLATTSAAYASGEEDVNAAETRTLFKRWPVDEKGNRPPVIRKIDTHAEHASVEHK